LLLLSIYLFLTRRWVWAILSVSIACLLHSAYLFSAGLLVAAFLFFLLVDNLSHTATRTQGLVERVWQAARQPVALGLLALAFALPVVWYTGVYLADSSAETGARALQILVHERIPFHSLPEVRTATAWRWWPPGGSPCCSCPSPRR
jgi:hypothetical protein